MLGSVGHSKKAPPTFPGVESRFFSTIVLFQKLGVLGGCPERCRMESRSWALCPRSIQKAQIGGGGGVDVSWAPTSDATQHTLFFFFFATMFFSFPFFWQTSCFVFGSGQRLPSSLRASWDPFARRRVQARGLRDRGAAGGVFWLRLAARGGGGGALGRGGGESMGSLEVGNSLGRREKHLVFCVRVCWFRRIVWGTSEASGGLVVHVGCAKWAENQ